MPDGISALLPALISGLPAAGSIVCVGPPLLVSAPSIKFAPNARLLPLLPESAKPVALPMALKLTFIAGLPVARISGALALVLPEMMELATVMVAGVLRPMPPPPVPAAAPLAVLPLIVESE